MRILSEFFSMRLPSVNVGYARGLLNCMVTQSGDKTISSSSHKPVLLHEVENYLAIKKDGIYVDATFGRGGHAEMILENLSDNGILIVIDKDPEAIEFAYKKFANDKRVKIFHGSFVNLAAWVRELGYYGRVDGILLDLGVSSPQLDDSERGFSFMRSGPLDMRMDTTTGMSVAKWLETATVVELTDILKEFGEERFAHKIATAIVTKEAEEKITTTKMLADIVTSALPYREKHKHPATRTFQALRIFINQEIAQLENVLRQTVDILCVGGRLVVISFHSLEDRIVKRFMRLLTHGEAVLKKIPIVGDSADVRFKLVGKFKPTQLEIAVNPRARSAILRVAEKIK